MLQAVRRSTVQSLAYIRQQTVRRGCHRGNVNLHTCCKQNEDNYFNCTAPSYVQSAVVSVPDPCDILLQCPWIQGLPLRDLGYGLSVLYDVLLCKKKKTLKKHAFSLVPSKAFRYTVAKGPAAAVFHVNIIQSDGWLICFAILITLHINSYYQHVYFMHFHLLSLGGN